MLATMEISNNPLKRVCGANGAAGGIICPRCATEELSTLEAAKGSTTVGRSKVATEFAGLIAGAEIAAVRWLVASVWLVAKLLPNPEGAGCPF